MKKNKCITLVLAALLITGIAHTASAQYVYDESVPPEQSCTLQITRGFVTAFDGVKTGLHWWVRVPMLSKQVIIPAGIHSLEVFANAEIKSGDTIITKSVAGTITYEFLPGRIYGVYTAIKPGTFFKDDETIAKIIDLCSANDLIPDPTRLDASPLEGTWVQATKNGIKIIISGNEFIFINGGTYRLRGYVSLDGNKVPLLIMADYQNKRWVMSDSSGEGKPIESLIKVTFDGTTLFYGKKALEKMP